MRDGLDLALPERKRCAVHGCTRVFWSATRVATLTRQDGQMGAVKRERMAVLIHLNKPTTGTR
jgi:hypothetical protein